MRSLLLLLVLLSLPADATLADPVAPGITVLLETRLDLVRGRRVGLATHAAAVDAAGRRTADLLAARADLVALLALEHGVGGRVAAGRPIDEARDPATGVPVRPLYPEVADRALAGLDVVAVDVQDAGVRSYTYPWSVVRLLRAAAARRLPVVVLDRPDPQGGRAIEGPLPADGRRSLLGEHPVPVVYGMTIGELLRLVNAEQRIGADLTVVPLRGWRRGMTWEETGLPWVPPSPNLPDPDTVRLFAGIGMIEGTNLSDGVGWRPFHAVGAPWIDGARLSSAMRARSLPGVRFEPVSFVPAAGPRAGVRCAGVRVIVTDPAAFRPVATVLHLLEAIARQRPGALTFAPIFDRLWGTPAVRRALERRDGMRAIVRSAAADAARFAAVRARYLLYR